MQKQEMLELADIVAQAVVKALEHKTISANSKLEKPEKTAYQKTEQLLFAYRGFQRIIGERMQEIEDLRKYGVPRSCAVTEYVQKGGMPSGIVLEEESVEAAVHRIQQSIQPMVEVIAMIDRKMAKLKLDPYYKILEYRYFEGRTQEDIAVELACNQTTIARNKSRLIKELAMELFPNQVLSEMME